MPDTSSLPLILASESPRRRELLALLGVGFQTLASRVDESRYPGESPEAYACRLSLEKSWSVAARLNAPALILAADTIVVDGMDVLGKPGDSGEAEAMLRRLRGRTHRVITAVALLNSETGLSQLAAPASPVAMRHYTDDEVAAYIATGDPFDKAGGYAIQHPGFNPAEAFDGCYATVVGLPLCYVGHMLEQAGIRLSPEGQAACANHMGYRCPFYPRLRPPQS